MAFDQHKEFVVNHMEQGRHGACQNINNKPVMGIKFDGVIKELHPHVFLNALKNKTRHMTSVDSIKEVLRTNMREKAAVWYASVDSDILSYDRFEERFLAYYWGEVAQARHREYLYYGKYNPTKRHDMME